MYAFIQQSLNILGSFKRERLKKIFGLLVMVLVLYPSFLFTLLTKNKTEFITEYGGYGLKGDWKTLGEASVDLTFENERVTDG
ncbi:MAG: hypothetical protein QW147_05550 [Candidatus Bathyarchaeia archaeon]